MRLRCNAWMVVTLCDSTIHGESACMAPSACTPDTHPILPEAYGLPTGFGVAVYLRQHWLGPVPSRSLTPTPYHDESSRIGSTPGFDLAFFVQGELLAQKEYFRRQFWVRA